VGGRARSGPSSDRGLHKGRAHLGGVITAGGERLEGVT
jgi:hypothetical protein